MNLKLCDVSCLHVIAYNIILSNIIKCYKPVYNRNNFCLPEEDIYVIMPNIRLHFLIKSAYFQNCLLIFFSSNFPSLEATFIRYS